jgi:hypothetical protein
MARSYRWGQRFMSKFDELGRRLGGGPAVGPHGAFVALAHRGDRDEYESEFRTQERRGFDKQAKGTVIHPSVMLRR